jgi:hypothetical protein
MAYRPNNHLYYIYKTSDGGQNWNLDFSLDAFHYLYTICKKNGKV